MTDNTSENDMGPALQAMVWYKAEDWNTLVEMFSDSHMLPKSYAEWLQKAEEMAKKVETDGDIVMKVFIDPVTFPAWCKEKGRKMDRHARADLAIEVATQQSFGPKV